jgi:hypothetical protein
MTSLVRRTAGGLTVLESVWLLYAYFDSGAAVVNCVFCLNIPAFIPMHSILTPVLVGLLLVVGAFGIWGASFSYLAGALLSGVTILITGFTVAILNDGYLSTVSNDAIIGLAFGLVGLLANIDGIRSKSKLSEQANPMNLPVFG